MMDPDAALAAIRAALEVLDTTEDSREHADAVEQLAQHARALDEWMSKGGFMPGAWAQGKRRADAEAAVIAYNESRGVPT